MEVIYVKEEEISTNLTRENPLLNFSQFIAAVFVQLSELMRNVLEIKLDNADVGKQIKFVFQSSKCINKSRGKEKERKTMRRKLFSIFLKIKDFV